MSIEVKSPLFFHREYEHDFASQNPDEPSQLMRAAKVALPFIALYRPIGWALASGLSATRAFVSLQDCTGAADAKELSWALLRTGVAVGAVAGTIFLHPVGMVITTISDVGMNLTEFAHLAGQGEVLQAAKMSMRVANNSFYLAMLLMGSVELQLAALTLQVLVEGASSYEEFYKGNLLETVGHIGMAMVRMNQTGGQVGQLMKSRNAIQLSSSPEMREMSNVKAAKPVEPVIRRASDFDAAGAVDGKWRPELSLLKNQHSEHLRFAGVLSEESYVMFGDPVTIAVTNPGAFPVAQSYGDEGNLVAVWHDAEQSGEWETLPKMLKASHFDAASQLWSSPEKIAAGVNVQTGEVDPFRILSVDGQGNASVLHSTYDSHFDHSKLYASTFSSSSGVWTNQHHLGDAFSDVFTDKLFDTASDQRGNISVVWSSVPLEGKELFTIANYDVASQAWSPAEIISIDYPLVSEVTGIFAQTVSRNDSGDIAVLSQGYNELFATTYHAKSGQWNPSVQIADAREDLQTIGLLPFGNDQFIAAYGEEFETNDLDDFYQIFSAQLSADTGKMVHESLVTEGVGGLNMDLSLRKDPQGNLLLFAGHTTGEEIFEQLDWDEIDFDWLLSGNLDISDEDLENEIFKVSAIKQLIQWCESITKNLDLSFNQKIFRMDPSQQKWKDVSVEAGSLFSKIQWIEKEGDLYAFWNRISLESFKEKLNKLPLDKKLNLDEIAALWTIEGVLSRFDAVAGTLSEPKSLIRQSGWENLFQDILCEVRFPFKITPSGDIFWQKGKDWYKA